MVPAKSTKSPAFQFYPKDFLCDEEQTLLSLPQVGAYTRLMCHCWLKGSLPPETKELARLCGATAGQMDKFWAGISKCFRQRADGRWIHPRLEVERKNQAEYRRRQSDAAASRWHKPDGSRRNALLSSSASSSATTKEKEIDTTPPLLSFPVDGSLSEPLWILTQGRVDRWLEQFPNVDVLGECRRALAWAEANPAKRKTARGMPAFLVNWLNSATNRPRQGPALVTMGGRGRTGAAPRGKYDGIGEG